MEEKVARDTLFRRIGGEAVCPGKVHDLHFGAVIPVKAGHLLNRNPGIVCHMLAGPCKGIEHRGFAGIGLTCQSQ